MVQVYYNYFPLLLLAFALAVAIVLACLRARVAAVIVVVVGVLVVAAMLVPSMIPAKKSAQRNGCIANLRQIQGAKELWAQREGKGAGAPVPEAALFGTNGLIGRPLLCPGGGTYTLGVLGQDPRCSLEESQGHRIR